MADVNCTLKTNDVYLSTYSNDKQDIGLLKVNDVYLSTYSNDKQDVSVLKPNDVYLSTYSNDKQAVGRYSIELTSGTVYYAMRGKNNSGYKTWVASGAPDTTASQYTGPVDGTMTDIVVLQTWSS